MALRRQHPDRPLIVTCNTTSGRDLVNDWRLANVGARLAPLDYRWVLARFRARWRPVALMILENELWPNRIATAAEPVICIAARLSARSAARWGRLGGLASATVGKIAYLAAQDEVSGQRFAALGLGVSRIGPVISLKQAVELAPPPPAELAEFQRIFARADTVLAASTHAGEDAAIIDAFARARAARPALKLILAPRHPRRMAEVAALITAAGLPYAVRSKGEVPDAATAVYLADTLGEMALWYALAGVSFVGGSLVDRGGHTPFEPLQAGSAVLHGPYVSNFAAAYAELDQAGASRQVADADDLSKALTALRGADSQVAMAQAASALISAGHHSDLSPALAAVRTAIRTP